MSTQVLCLNPRDCPIKATDEIVVMPFDRAQAFDMFDLVVVNLQQKDLWRCSRDNRQSIDSMAHFDTLASMIGDSKSSEVLILLPQNYTFNYDYRGGGYNSRAGYYKHTPLKDMLEALRHALLLPLLHEDLPLAFGCSVTKCGSREFSSDFHLMKEASSGFEEFAESKAGGITCFSISERVTATTLFVEDSAALIDLCQGLKLLPTEQRSFPSWLEEVPLLDEENLRKRRQAILDEVARLENEKVEIDTRLSEYREKKAVLCTKDFDLEHRAREMLAKILKIDSDFEDVREEDFHYETDDCVYVFEIKGSVKGLKREQVSKTENHVQICADSLEEMCSNKRVKGILIFSSQIEIPPSQRDSYPQKQLEIAARYEVAVMSAETLLRYYEASERGNLGPNDFIEILDSSSGFVEPPSFS